MSDEQLNYNPPNKRIKILETIVIKNPNIPGISKSVASTSNSNHSELRKVASHKIQEILNLAKQDEYLENFPRSVFGTERSYAKIDDEDDEELANLLQQADLVFDGKSAIDHQKIKENMKKDYAMASHSHNPMPRPENIPSWPEKLFPDQNERDLAAERRELALGITQEAMQKRILKDLVAIDDVLALTEERLKHMYADLEVKIKNQPLTLNFPLTENSINSFPKINLEYFKKNYESRPLFKKALPKFCVKSALENFLGVNNYTISSPEDDNITVHDWLDDVDLENPSPIRDFNLPKSCISISSTSSSNASEDKFDRFLATTHSPSPLHTNKNQENDILSEHSALLWSPNEYALRKKYVPHTLAIAGPSTDHGLVVGDKKSGDTNSLCWSPNEYALRKKYAPQTLEITGFNEELEPAVPTDDSSGDFKLNFPE